MNQAPLLVALLLWAGSALLFGLFLRALLLRIAMRRWHRGRGIVREQKVHSHRNLHGAGHHRPIVMVEYSAAGRKRLIRCDSPTRMGFAQKESAQATLAQFPVGQSVEIYVDPKDPERAYLYPPEVSALIMLSVGSLFLLVVGIGMH